MCQTGQELANEVRSPGVKWRRIQEDTGLQMESQEPSAYTYSSFGFRCHELLRYFMQEVRGDEI